MPVGHSRSIDSCDVVAPPRVEKARAEKEVAVEAPRREKPVLEVPNSSILFLMTSKLFLRSDMQDLASCKEQIKANNLEADDLRQKRREESKKLLEKKKIDEAWSMSVTVTSIMITSLEIFSGLFMLFSGNVVAGTLLVAGGVVQLTNHIMKETKAWEEVAQLLPGDSLEEKQAVVMWMQIGLGILSLMLAGAGGMIGGKAALTEGSQLAKMFTGSVLLAAVGITSLGSGISQKEYKDEQAIVKRTENELAKLESLRKNYTERVETHLDNVQNTLSASHEVLEMDYEIHRALGG